MKIAQWANIVTQSLKTTAMLCCYGTSTYVGCSLGFEKFGIWKLEFEFPIWGGAFGFVFFFFCIDSSSIYHFYFYVIVVVGKKLELRKYETLFGFKKSAGYSKRVRKQIHYELGGAWQLTYIIKCIT